MKFINHYDKFTLALPSVYFFNSNTEFEESRSINGNLVSQKLNLTGLLIFVNHQKSQTLITISGKSITEATIKLISARNIASVHEIISKFITIPYDQFLTSLVLTTDVTEDITVYNPELVINSTFKIAELQTKYKVPRQCRKSGKKSCSFWLKKNNTNNRYVDFISIYDKEVEFLKSSNRANQQILQNLNPQDRNKLLTSLQNKIRIEVSLNSAYMIRKHYGLPHGSKPTLRDLLESEIPVVKNMFKTVFAAIETIKEDNFKPKNMTELSYFLTLKENDFDLQKTKIYLLDKFGDEKKASRILKKLGQIKIGNDADQYAEVRSVYNHVLALL